MRSLPTARARAQKSTSVVNAFGRLGRFVVRHPWWVIGAWAVLLLLALPFAPQAGSALQAGGFTSDQLESARARETLSNAGSPAFSVSLW